MEEWKVIEEFSNYEVSNKGRIRNIKTGKVKRLSIANNGYYMVDLYDNYKRKNCTVHRLVALHFIDNPNNLPIVNHKDENKLNNDVSNLEWCTFQYNLNYGTVQERKITNTDYVKQAEKLRNHPLKSKKVAQYNLNGELVKIYPSTRELERVNKEFNSRTIAHICCGDTKKKEYKGFRWSYV